MRTCFGPKPLERDETLARFLYSSSHLNNQKTEVKPGAFLPARNLKTSVFRQTRMTRECFERVRDTLAQRRTQRSGQTHKATALIDLADVLSTGLQVVPEESEFKWHADIAGWPDDANPPEAKARQKELAGVLAQSARVEVP